MLSKSILLKLTLFFSPFWGVAAGKHLITYVACIIFLSDSAEKDRVWLLMY